MCPLSYTSENSTEQSIDEKLLETGEWPATPIKVSNVDDKFLVFNHTHGSLLYGFGRYFGIPVGIRKPKKDTFERPLELSIFEALYLLTKGHVVIFSAKSEIPLEIDDLHAFGCENYPDFKDKYTIYKDLREKNYIPRPGQKFGADFIVYEQGPGKDHSSFCIQVLSQISKISSIDVVRSARLATSVKKRFVLANPKTKSYFSFKWFKP